MDSNDLWLEISEAGREAARRRAEPLGAPPAVWRAYLAGLALAGVQDWLCEAGCATRIWPGEAALPSFWPWVAGTALAVGKRRLLVVADEASMADELRVPQEWIDIPGWAADYYLAAQVEPEAGAVQLWGFISHRRLKEVAVYDAQRRQYCLIAGHLVREMACLPAALHLELAEPTRAPLAALPTLPLGQARQLLARLGDPVLPMPQWTVPFGLWGALIAHGGWRQKLYELRLGLPEQRSVPDWIQAGVSPLGELAGWRRWRLRAEPGGTRARGLPPGGPPVGVLLTRRLRIAGADYELQLQPVESPDGSVWRFELQAAEVGAPVPPGFVLRLLAEDLQGFANNEDSAEQPVERLYVEVAVDPGDTLTWEIEPEPEDFDREILRLA
ncbi:DUF1822 family protein [Gloeobacter morelensis]|uniref:DUF1822 family protein n=1 Tax=Gloeobacter morelensis MG652769 TaxID=2781736 RepID=A0ABY3PJ61_9CYAN|nr:DUF1822 family protein [Gloeobacter morelensis]UFP93706.1 DUF1822 family protein [Gloeobacter morelensis MG652769]